MQNIILLGSARTPIGDFGALFSSTGLLRLSYPSESLDVCAAWVARYFPHAQVQSTGRWLIDLAEQLSAYFERQLTSFTVPLDLRGTDFQRYVWQGLQAIPYGQTRAYSELAVSIGHPRAVRAVGAANGANPIPILVPCHRLISKHGSLIKYGGGLALKRRLLELEGAPGF